MRSRYRFALPILTGFCIAVASTLALSQATAPVKPAIGTPIPPAEVYGKLLDNLEKNFVSAAEAMPEDKYNFSPPLTMGEFKGVRTFGEEVKHVALANSFFFHDPAKPLVDNRADFAKLKTKAEIVQALKDSFALAHTYVGAITVENAFLTTSSGTRAGTASQGLAHLNDHYGQMVVYLRMNGIIPPASATK
jgi:hypothetical protein